MRFLSLSLSLSLFSKASLSRYHGVFSRYHVFERRSLRYSESRCLNAQTKREIKGTAGNTRARAHQRTPSESKRRKDEEKERGRSGGLTGKKGEGQRSREKETSKREKTFLQEGTERRLLLSSCRPTSEQPPHRQPAFSPSLPAASNIPVGINFRVNIEEDRACVRGDSCSHSPFAGGPSTLARRLTLKSSTARHFLSHGTPPFSRRR